MEFSTVEESEQGSSPTDSLSEDVTDVSSMEVGRRKKEEGRIIAQTRKAQLSISNDQ
ncbi:hypothetical protein QUA30_15830 [Microcoleus sp. Pol14C2]|uniref:hypothetical protein n=1 Tax=unclassified Microcoleus TaxID=2642155 RepID=UPI002FCF8BED